LPARPRNDRDLLADLRAAALELRPQQVVERVNVRDLAGIHLDDDDGVGPVGALADVDVDDAAGECLTFDWLPAALLGNMHFGSHLLPFSAAELVCPAAELGSK